MSAKAMVKMASELTKIRGELKVLEEKIAAYESRENAENLLLDIISGKESAPKGMKPYSIDDFMAKRAKIEEHGLETAKLAMEMNMSQNFEIGEPQESRLENLGGDGSKADALFLEYIEECDSSF